MSVLTSPLPLRSLEALSPGFIARTLDLYREESVAIEAASWDGRELVSQVRPIEYPFTKPGHIDYVTGGMALLYASQSAYITARVMILSGDVPSDCALSDEYFFSTRDSGDLVFVDVALRFRRKLPINGPSHFVLRQSLGALRSTRSHVLGRLAGDLGDGACTISGILAIPVARRNRLG